MPSRWDTVQSDGSEMRCYVSAPDGEGPHPAVVVIQHAGGVDEFVRGMTDRFGGEGYFAIAPDLYHRDDPNTGDDPLTKMGRLRDTRIITDVNSTVDHLKARGEVNADQIGITGFCMGGRVAYLMAAQNPAFQASVVFYGGNTMVSWGEGTPPFEQTENIRCPVMGLFGEDDGNPSPADVAKIDVELTKHGVEHEFHSYRGAGHGFMAEGRPNYREEPARDAWQKCTGWFEKHLKA
jgi:carboxymethylenebutenolidase